MDRAEIVNIKTKIALGEKLSPKQVHFVLDCINKACGIPLKPIRSEGEPDANPHS
jgi:hypothetical protein